MFKEQFIKETSLIQSSLHEKIKRYGVPSPDVKDNLKLYETFYTFLQNYIPDKFSFAMSPVRNKKQVLTKPCDLVIYKKWCDSYMKLTNGYVLIEDIKAFFTLQRDISDPHVLSKSISLTRALKALYTQKEGEHILPIYSIFFAYRSNRSILYWKHQLLNILKERQVDHLYQLDLVCILDKGLIIRNWESDASSYIGIETGPDTLLWFYVILMEYLDHDANMGVNLRDYIKTSVDYAEC